MRRGYLNYSFEAELENLSYDVIEACRILKKGLYIIEVFSKDLLNNILLSNACCIFQNGNFNYYLCEHVDFFHMINLADARHICIYSVLEIDKQQINIGYLKDNFTFYICFENYLNTSQLMVCRKYYSDGIETILCPRN